MFSILIAVLIKDKRLDDVNRRLDEIAKRLDRTVRNLDDRERSIVRAGEPTTLAR